MKARKSRRTATVDEFKCNKYVICVFRFNGSAFHISHYKLLEWNLGWDRHKKKFVSKRKTFSITILPSSEWCTTYLHIMNGFRNDWKDRIVFCMTQQQSLVSFQSDSDTNLLEKKVQKISLWTFSFSVLGRIFWNASDQIPSEKSAQKLLWQSFQHWKRLLGVKDRKIKMISCINFKSTQEGSKRKARQEEISLTRFLFAWRKPLGRDFLFIVNRCHVVGSKAIHWNEKG